MDEHHHHQPRESRRKSVGQTLRTLGGSKDKEKERDRERKDRESASTTTAAAATMQKKINPLYAVRELSSLQPPPTAVSSSAGESPHKESKKKVTNPTYGMSSLRGMRRLEFVDSSSPGDNGGGEALVAPPPAAQQKKRDRLSGVTIAATATNSKEASFKLPDVLALPAAVKTPGAASENKSTIRRSAGSAGAQTAPRRLIRYNSEKKMASHQMAVAAAAAGSERAERAKLIKKLRAEIKQQQKREQAERESVAHITDQLVRSIFGEEDKNGDLLWARMGIRRHVEAPTTTADVVLPSAAAGGMVDDILLDLMGQLQPREVATAVHGQRRRANIMLDDTVVRLGLPRGRLDDDVEDDKHAEGGRFSWLDLARAGKEARDRTSTVDYMVDDMIFGSSSSWMLESGAIESYAAPPLRRSPQPSAHVRSSRTVWERRSSNGSARSKPSEAQAEVDAPADLLPSRIIVSDGDANADAGASSLVCETPKAAPALSLPESAHVDSPAPPPALSPPSQATPVEESESEFLASFQPELRSLPHHILLAIKSQQESRNLKATAGRGALLPLTELRPNDDDGAAVRRRRGTTTVVRQRKQTESRSAASVRRTKSERFLSSWDYSVQQIYKTNSGFVSTLVSGPMLEEPKETKQETMAAVAPLGMGRHRSASALVREAANTIVRRTTRSSSVFGCGPQGIPAPSSRATSFMFGSYTDTSSMADSSAIFLSSCSSSTFNHTTSISRTSSFSATDMSATDLLSEAALDSVDNSEASDTEPDEERDEDELDNDLQLPLRELSSGAHTGHRYQLPSRYGMHPAASDGRKAKKNVSAADLNKILLEEELSPDEQAVLDDYQRQLDELLQKRVTEVKYVEGMPVSGTVDGLVAALFHEENAVDPMYFDVFLATHRYFMSPQDLLSRLQDVYMSVPLTTRFGKTYKHLRSQLHHIRLRVVNLLKKWLETFFSDFADPGLVKDLEAFEKLMSGLGGKSLHWQAIIRIHRAKAQLKQDKVGRRGTVGRDAPKPLVPRQLQSPSLLDFHPLEVARQLALIDWELFAAIPHREFVGKAWDSPASSPVSQKWFNHYEKVKGALSPSSGIHWVATEIVMTPNPKQRAIVLQRFIEIAECCLSLNNFNGTIQIITALGTSFVARLKTAWKSVPPKYTSKLRALEELVVQADGYARLKAYMAELSPPLVPYHQLLQHDLGLLEERQANFVGTQSLTQSVTSKRRREGTKNPEVKGVIGGGGGNGNGGGGGSEKKESKIRQCDGEDVADASTLAASSSAKQLSSRSYSGTTPNAPLWVNFEKMTSIGQALLEIAVLQTTPLRLDEVAVIRKYLVNPPMVLGEKHLRIRSRSCEPAQESPISAARRRNSREKDKIELRREDSKRGLKQSSIRGVGLSLSAAVKKTFTDKKKAT